MKKILVLGLNLLGVACLCEESAARAQEVVEAERVNAYFDSRQEYSYHDNLDSIRAANSIGNVLCARLDNERVAEVLSALQGKNVEELRLVMCDINDTSLNRVMQLLGENSSLRYLVIDEENSSGVPVLTFSTLNIGVALNNATLERGTATVTNEAFEAFVDAAEQAPHLISIHVNLSSINEEVLLNGVQRIQARCTENIRLGSR